MLAEEAPLIPTPDAGEEGKGELVVDWNAATDDRDYAAMVF